MLASGRACGAAVHRPTLLLVRHHTGYIPFEGRKDKREDEFARFSEQRLLINLQPVKKINFSFDPFKPNIRGIRNVMHAFSYENVRNTNVKCTFKTDVKSDGSDPLVKVELNEGNKEIVFKAGNLTGLEILFHFNKFVLPLVKEVKATITETKGAKLSDAKGGSKKGKK